MGGVREFMEEQFLHFNAREVGKVHAISCTGANLEEDVFNFLAHDEYEVVRDWRALSASSSATSWMILS